MSNQLVAEGQETIEAIRARVDAATPGPWEVVREVSYDHLNGEQVSFSISGPDASDDEANAELMAHAPEDLGALLRAIEGALAQHAACYGGRGCETTEAIYRALEGNR